MERPKSDEQPEEFASAIQRLCDEVGWYYAARKRRKEEADMPAPMPGEIRIFVRPRGTHLSMRAEVPFEIFRYGSDNGKKVLGHELKKIFEGARRSFGSRDLFIDISTERSEKVFQMRYSFAAAVKTVIEPAEKAQPETKIESQHEPESEQEVEPEPVVEPEPEPEPVFPPESDSEPDPEPAAEPESEMNGEDAVAMALIPEEAMHLHMNPDAPINYKSMKYWPKDMAPGTIRKAFSAIGITTGRHILKLLGTTEPTRREWGIFIAEIRKRVEKEGLRFTETCDGTLYWWLTKRMKWITPFAQQSNA